MVQDILLADEDTNLDNPVDLNYFEQIKSIRQMLKKKNADWVADYKRAFQRDPMKQDYEEIKDQMNEYELYNKKYSLMKAKMVRQGLWTTNFASKLEAQPETNAAIKRRMTMTAGAGFGASAMQPNSSKGFATTDMTIGDPSLKKMKEEISIKEQKNQELTDEIKRLKHRL